ncbi:MAG: pyridoxamine 5'-phosphate oxidase family protein [Bacteroidota bacterium]|nr:pyridoxamine 5'-phosphate oxidase family protein [Bacteroidota bacterium]
MNEIIHLTEEEGIEKMKAMAEKIRSCMFCTGVDSLPFETRPMSTLKVNDGGCFWFFSSIDSNKNFEIVEDSQVQLIYTDPSDDNYMSVYGRAEISKEPQKIEELWNDLAKTWFKKGKDDPGLTVICVRPEQVQFWDAKRGKMILLMNMRVAK